MTPEDLMAEYETRLNSHDPEQVIELLDEKCTFWFSDGSYEGIDEIRQKLKETWQTVREEEYGIRQLHWLALGDDAAACIYHFEWTGLIDGERRSGGGRGTSVLSKASGEWKIVHEHLSRPV